jgi:DegV family protein with EDD domain
MGIRAEKVPIVDSNSTSMGMGYQVLAVVRIAEEGGSLADCKRLVEIARGHVCVYFAVDTLEFLRRRGRIGGAQRFIGSVLNLKPILALNEGHIEPEDRVRTMRKAIDHLIDLVAGRVKDKSNVHLATLHANAEHEAAESLDRVCQRISPVESLISSVSPVIGAHTSPGTLGLAFMGGI